ncbi:MAG: hypothetical protein ABI678_13230 [Kofleriaceae bacterium]
MIALILGASVIVGGFALGRAAFDAKTGAWAAAVLAGAHPLAIRSAELIGDLPATGCLLGAVAILIGELERERVRWRVVAAAPLFAAAFYLRYGSAPVIAMIGVLAVILYARRLACVPIAVMALVAALLVVPHVVHSIHATGSPLGILSVSAHMPRRAYVGEGLVTYVTSNPFRFYGALVAPVMIAGGLSLVRVRRRAAWFVVLLALGQFVSLGIQSHAQPRYVFFATALLVIAGVAMLRPYLGRVAALVCALAWLGVAIAIVPYQHWLADQRAPLYAAAEAIRSDARERPCAIAANVAPQLIWITRCEVVIAKTAPKLEAPWPAGNMLYVASVPHAQVPPALLGELARIAGAMPMALIVASPDARAWRLDRP